jgi:murein DD-endopeptidase MepM/ murein hydrolase activator NlpD
VLRGALTAARTRLAALQVVATRAEAVLSRQLISVYETDQFDIVSVVLEATGFTDLLERLSFAQRIQNQDVRIIGQASAARSAVAAQATRLGALNARQQTVTTQALSARNSLYRATATLLQQRIAVAQARATDAGQLVDARAQIAVHERQLSTLEAAQAAGESAAQSGRTGQQSSAGGSPSISTSGGFVFPMPKRDAAPPGTWTLDQGVDIAAPGGTPLLAVGSGTVVLHGIGGFGPSAPVLHLDSGPYVYYGHAGPGRWVAVGTHVNAGQVISEVGDGDVGVSSGPHLEIGFADSSGSPIGSHKARKCCRCCKPPTQASCRSRVSRIDYAYTSALLAQLVEHFHGKEGVVGSSPTEGSDVCPGNEPEADTSQRSKARSADAEQKIREQQA